MATVYNLEFFKFVFFLTLTYYCVLRPAANNTRCINLI